MNELDIYKRLVTLYKQRDNADLYDPCDDIIFSETASAINQCNEQLKLVKKIDNPFKKVIINSIRRICYQAMQRETGWSYKDIHESINELGFKDTRIDVIKSEYPHNFIVTTTVNSEGFIVFIKSGEFIYE